MSTTASLVTGVDFICMPVKDYDAAFQFYSEVLGGQVGWRRTRA